MSEHSTTPLAAVWSQITLLLESGFSLIPVRDKPENGKPAKSPYPYWKQYQQVIISAGELWMQMEKFNTSAIAFVCGKVSGNLEVIDIDVKWKPGIDAKLFSDIKQLYPKLWDRLRLHRSPSGGFHIPYKIIDRPPVGSQKLAQRLSVPEDATKTKMVSFIETRGEGGIILIPPSLGYSIYKAEPIPLLTWEERCALISLCSGYNEVFKVESQPKANRYEGEYYDENPFDHFNRSEEGYRVLLDLGWKANGDNNKFSWFIKPGSSSKERHAAFIKAKNVFYFWSTNTEFESQKCYTPSAVLALGKHGNDFKKLYQELVTRGFGKIRANKEKRLIKTTKTELPANISDEGKKLREELIRERNELHPYGIFWEINPEGDRVSIDREGLYIVSEGLGFRLYKGAILRLKGSYLYKVEERDFQDIVKGYIKERDPIQRLLILNTYEHFLQVAGKFTLTRLPLLEEKKLMLDTQKISYKFFSDVWVKITESQVESYPYDKLPGYVFADKVLERPYIVANSGRYIDFLSKCINFNVNKDLTEYILKVIGYLAHEYKDETTAYIIVLTEECPDPRMGGGSGKNLFCNLFKSITSLTGRPGEQIRYDEKFFQSWNMEKLFVISDAPKDFNFLFLKEITSGSAVLKKLFKDEIEVTVDNLPKIIVNTNYSYEIVDGGLRRRIIPLEFTNFFTINEGVRNYYGVHFPTEWTADDWAGYNAVMIRGIQTWLGANLNIGAHNLTQGGWKKQFEQVFGIYASEFIYDSFSTWLEKETISNFDFKKQVFDYFEDKGIAKMYQPSIHKINKAIDEYGHRFGVEVSHDIQVKEGGVNTRCKQFKIKIT